MVDLDREIASTRDVAYGLSRDVAERRQEMAQRMRHMQEIVEEARREGLRYVDSNGEVNFQDFLILSTNFGKPASSWGAGDFDADGSVAFADFLELSSNFGFTALAATDLGEKRVR